MNANQVDHLAILASAGSGKTFRLAHRFIELMARGEEPERIGAMTFSRKAAGEIFDTIVNRLCEASRTEDIARDVGRHAKVEGLRSRDCLSLLESLLEAMDRLQIGTLDSFAVRIVRAFPLELGIPMEFDVMESGGSVARAARSEVLRGILERRLVKLSAQEGFLQSFKQATFGEERKSLVRELDRFVKDFHTTYRIHPVESGWGVAGKVWPRPSPWFSPVKDVKEGAARLRAFAVAKGYPDSIRQRWFDFADEAARYRPGSPWIRPIEYMMKKLLPLADELPRGSIAVRLDRTDCELDAKAGEACMALVRHVMWCEILKSLETTSGIFQILHAFEGIYNDRVRRLGRLTFEDIQFLLYPETAPGGGTRLSTVSGDDRLYIDYRLDGRLDHWLLDEFQDTSDLQWSVLENLIDEVVQDPTGRRTFFYVGDVKQAVYGWRGGNARLFQQIRERYGKKIRDESLQTSYRSCMPVIECVNAVFSRLPGNRFPPEMAERWHAGWETHKVAAGMVPATGLVSLLSPAAETDRYSMAAGILEEIDPIRRDVSVAVLVRTNDEGAELVKVLRSQCGGMPIMHEGNAGITDNPVVNGLLALVKAAAHPGDEFAWMFVQMTPLARVLEARKLTRETIPLEILGGIYAGGFRRFFREWGDALTEVVRLDRFGLRRLDDLVDAAGEFDTGGGRDPDAFLDFMEGYTLREGASRNAVRVMTIHQAKGLDFDMVILPAMQGPRSMVGGGGSEIVTSFDAGSGEPAWTLRMPRLIVSEQDDVLAAEIRRHSEEKSFESVCLWYVAMTRARKAMYMIIDRPKPGSKAYPPAAFILEQLAPGGVRAGEVPAAFGGRPVHCHYAVGAWEWYRSEPEREETVASAEDPENKWPPPCGSKALSGRAVTDHASRGNPFADESAESRAFGSAIHELFERVDWLPGSGPAAVAEAWMDSASQAEDFCAAAAEHFRNACEAEPVGTLMARPPGPVRLWRERPFRVILDGALLSGRFDRVVVELDEEGAPRHATVVDFKTDGTSGADTLGAAAEPHRAQMEFYRRALSRLLALAESEIECRVVFTSAGEVVAL